MLDPRSTHGDLAPFDRGEESEDIGPFADHDSGDPTQRPFECSENVNAVRPRLICMGFGVIRI
jgi:hypothetical protein